MWMQWRASSAVRLSTLSECVFPSFRSAELSLILLYPQNNG